MNEQEIRYLYQQAYVNKEAGAIDDFLTWLRKLLGIKHTNTPWENVTTGAAGLGTGATAAGGAYGLYKYARNINPDNVGKLKGALSRGATAISKLPGWGKAVGFGLGTLGAIGAGSKLFDDTFHS